MKQRINESKLNHIVQESINDYMKKIGGAAKDKIKKGIDWYKDTLAYDEETDAENPSYVDWGEFGRGVVNGAKDKIKKGVNWYKDALAYDEETDAENPASVDWGEFGREVKDGVKSIFRKKR